MVRIFAKQRLEISKNAQNVLASRTSLMFSEAIRLGQTMFFNCPNTLKTTSILEELKKYEENCYFRRWGFNKPTRLRVQLKLTGVASDKK